MEQLERIMRLYHSIYLIAITGMIVIGVLTIILFIRWRIWEAIGILTGRTAMRAISSGQIKIVMQGNSVVNEDKTEKLWFREAQTTTISVDTGEKTVTGAGESDNFGVTEHLEFCPPKRSNLKMQILDEIIEIHSEERI